MKISKKLKLLATLGVASVALTSCSNTQMAVTGLALAGTIMAVGAYTWISNPDAETALASSDKNVFKSVQETIQANNSYTIESSTTGRKQSQLMAHANNKQIKIVVEKIGLNQSKIYIKDGRGKDQAQILLQQIVKNVK
jgi:hypothetical protein